MMVSMGSEVGLTRRRRRGAKVIYGWVVSAVGELGMGRASNYEPIHETIAGCRRRHGEGEAEDDAASAASTSIS